MDFIDCMLDPDILNDGVQSLPDVPKISAKELKAKFDHIVTELATSYNALIELLSSAEALNSFKGYDASGKEKTIQQLLDAAFAGISDLQKISGSQSIGTPDVVSGALSDVKTQLAYLYTLCQKFSADAITLNIPDDFKPNNAGYADSAGYATEAGKQTMLSATPAQLGDLYEVSSVTVPFSTLSTIGGGVGTQNGNTFTLTGGAGYLVMLSLDGYVPARSAASANFKVSFAGSSTITRMAASTCGEDDGLAPVIFHLDCTLFVPQASSFAASEITLTPYDFSTSYNRFVLVVQSGTIAIRKVV